MTDLQKKMFESIIDGMKKDAEGKADFYAPTQAEFPLEPPIDDTVYSNNIAIVLKNLIVGNYVEKLFPNGNEYVLTDKGWEFTTFQGLEAKRQESKYIDELHFDKLKKEVEALDKKLDNIRPDNARSNFAILISLVLLIVELVRCSQGR